MKEKNNNIFVVIIVILSILLIISIGYTIYDKIESSKQNNDGVSEQTNNSNETVDDVKADSTLIDNLIKKYRIETTEDQVEPHTNVLFDSLDSISDERVAELMYLVISIYGDELGIAKTDVKGYADKGYTVISSSDYEKAFKNYFGVDQNVRKLKIKDLSETEKKSEQNYICYKYFYNEEDSKYYTAGEYYGCGSDTRTEYKEYYVSSSEVKNSDTIVIYQKYFWYFDDNSGEYSIRWTLPNGKDGNFNTTLDPSSQEFKEKYGDYFSTIEYTFKKNSDNNYYVSSIKDLNNAKSYVK